MPCFTNDDIEAPHREGIWPQNAQLAVGSEVSKKGLFTPKPISVHHASRPLLLNLGANSLKAHLRERGGRERETRVRGSPCLVRRAREEPFTFLEPQFPQTVITGRKITAPADLSFGIEGPRQRQVCTLSSDVVARGPEKAEPCPPPASLSLDSP